MNFGLSDKNYRILLDIIGNYVKSGSVVVYGSRAKGDFTDRSDIDIVIRDCNEINDATVSRMIDEIDESDFPYLADIRIYDDIKNNSLREHIDRAGIVFFSKETLSEK